MTEREIVRALPAGASSFRVLLVEDTPSERAEYSKAMEEVGIQVVSVANLAEFQSHLKQGLYDLVVADVFIPRDDKNDEDQNCLREIIDMSRTATPPPPVVALTKRLQFNEVEGVVDELLDFIRKEPDGKPGSTVRKAQREPGYVAFKVIKLCHLLRRIRSSRALPAAIVDHVSRNPSHFGAKAVGDSVREYLRWTELDPGNNHLLAASLDQLQLLTSQTMGPLSGTMGEALKLYRDVENFILAGVPGSRGHMRHVINVYWLGYLVLNATDLPQRINRDIGDLNRQWLLAAVFHDVGLFLEKHDTITKQTKAWTEAFPQVERSAPHAALEYARTKMKDAFIRLFADDNQKATREMIIKKLDDIPIDHGLQSAYYLLDKTEAMGVAKIREDAKIAARAIALHNLIGKPTVPKVALKDDPITALLAFCDIFQSWDRDRADTALTETGLISQTQVGRWAVVSQVLYLDVVYPLHPAVLPGDSRIADARRALLKAIDTHVRPVVDRGIDTSPMQYKVGLYFADERVPLARFPET